MDTVSVSFSLITRFVNFLRRELIAILSFSFVVGIIIPSFIIGAKNIRTKYLYNHFSCEISSNSYLLPNSIIPIKYDLTVTPFISQSKFNGIIKIDLEIIKPTSCIYLNSLNLNILNFQFFDYSNKEYKMKLEYIPKYEQIILSYKGGYFRFRKGKYYLILKYTGIINHQKEMGLHFINNNMNNILSTSLQLNYARQVFPCFDEPNLKSNFKLQIINTNNTIIPYIISNTPLLNKIKNKYIFKTTSKISTCSFGFYFQTNIKLKNKTTNIVNTKIYNIYHNHLNLNQNLIQSLFNLTISTSNYLLNHFNLNFTKIDIIFEKNIINNENKIPNFGYLLLNEDLLFDKNSMKLEYLLINKLIKMFINHLITIESWTFNWIKDGLSNFLTFNYLKNRNEEYTLHLIQNEINSIIEIDSLSSSKTLLYNFKLNFGLDYLNSIKKGTILFKYLYNEMGNNSFFNWINDLKIELSMNDLSLLNTIPLKYKFILDRWIYFSGVPIIYINNNENNVQFFQKRFYSHFPLVNEINYWTIPFQYMNSNSSKLFKVTMNNTMLKYNQSLLKINDWILIKNELSFPYLINYPINVWNNLIKEIENNNTLISNNDKIKLLNDAYYLTKSGELNIKYLFNLILSLKNEKSYYVWINLTNIIFKISNILKNQFNNDEFILIHFNRFILNVLNETKNELNLQIKKNETIEEKEFKKLIFYSLGYFGDEDIIKISNEFNINQLNNELMNEIFKIKIMYSNSSIEYLQLLSLYQKYKSQQFYLPLTQTTNLNLISNVLNLLFLNQNKFESILYLLKNQFTNNLAWEFLRENYSVLKNDYSNLFLNQNEYLFIQYFNSHLKKYQVDHFFEGKEILKNLVDSNINFIRENLIEMKNWLKNYHQ
eukprot:gene8847-797_t